MTAKQQDKAIEILAELVAYMSEDWKVYDSKEKHMITGQKLIEKAQKFITKIEKE